MKVRGHHHHSTFNTCEASDISSAWGSHFCSIQIQKLSDCLSVSLSLCPRGYPGDDGLLSNSNTWLAAASRSKSSHIDKWLLLALAVGFRVVLSSSSVLWDKNKSATEDGCVYACFCVPLAPTIREWLRTASRLLIDTCRLSCLGLLCAFDEYCSPSLGVVLVACGGRLHFCGWMLYVDRRISSRRYPILEVPGVREVGARLICLHSSGSFRINCLWLKVCWCPPSRQKW